MTQVEIETAGMKLLRYMEKEEFKGYDPYDGLTSPLFELPVFKSSRKLRFLAQQAVKRSPVNLRPLLAIKKRLNPVTLGLAIQSYAQLDKANNTTVYKGKVNLLTEKLKGMVPKGFHGSCWGYDFPWEARYAGIPAFQPTVVATGIIAHGLYTAWDVYRDNEEQQLIINAAAFVVHDLNRFVDDEENICFSYSPFDRERVFNASMKGVRILCYAYSFNQKEEYRKLAAAGVHYLLKHQRDDGSWVYSERTTGDWIDNYHTGYILDCLDVYTRLCKDEKATRALQKGISFYIKHFVQNDGRPMFFASRPGPVDCTAAAQALLTLTRFGYTDEAIKTASWMISNMQDESGYFYYRYEYGKKKKTSYMRWSNAWMLAGLTSIGLSK